MGLFSFFSPKKENPTLPVRQYVLSNGFRGYKYFNVASYGDKESEHNHILLKDYVFPGKTITFSPGPASRDYSDPYYLVFIDNYKIGAIFDMQQIKDLANDYIDFVYAKHDEEICGTPKNLFKQHCIKLFVKYSEGVI